MLRRLSRPFASMPSSAVSSSSVLLTVSGEVPADLDERVASGVRPRADYRVMADEFGADLLDVGRALGEHRRIGRLIHRVAGIGPLLAWACWRRRADYAVVVTDGEQVGLPLALLGRLLGRAGTRHAMIVHVVSPRSKAALVKWARLAPLIDRWIVYCTAQAEFISRTFCVGPGNIVVTPFMVDTEFFSPQAVESTQPERAEPGLVEGGEPTRPMICAVGLERRDYPTLMRAVEGLDLDVVVAAASPWSKQANSADGVGIPDNVTVTSFSQFDLRDLYSRSSFSVMPLAEVDFQAGITAILESMSMERTVICTRTTGQTDTILGQDDPTRVGAATGVYVEAGDAAQLRAAIEGLLVSREECARLGGAARRWVVEHADVDAYARRLSSMVNELHRPD